MNNKKVFIFLLIFALGIFFYNFNKIRFRSYFGSQQLVVGEKEKRIDSEELNSRNYVYVFNNNVAQYSVYIVDERLNGTEYLVEAFFALNFQFIKDYGALLENFVCLVKLLGDVTGSEEEVVELKPVAVAAYYWHQNRKFTFKLKPESFKRAFKLEHLVIAVIRRGDYEKGNRSIEKITSIGQAIVLPFSLIQYQIPTVLKQLEPARPTVSVCAHYIYKIPEHFFTWVEMHLSFNVAEILLYDSTDNFRLSTRLEQKFGKDERISIRKYNINHEDLCRSNPLHPLEAQKLLRKLCFGFYDTEFREKFHGRYRHEQLTSNDCYSVLSRSHEFITYYDTDELVFPRQFDLKEDFKEAKFNCNSFSSICSTKPFQPSQGVNQSSFYYNYLRNVIDKYKGDKDISRLNSISFHHGAYMIPDHVEKQLVSDLGSAIQSIGNANVSSIKFPIKIPVGDVKGDRYQFIINQTEDVDYIKFFHDAYTSFIPCTHSMYLKTSVPEQLFNRHLFFLTHYEQRWPKAIHYYKNVRGLFIHYATDVAPGSWTLTPPTAHGHFLAHFRPDMNPFYNSKFENSVKNLHIDFEYVFYLLKQYTAFCEL